MYKNFTKKYVRNTAAMLGNVENITLHTHTNGTVCHLDFYFENVANYIFVTFENGIQLSLEYQNGILKVGTADEVFERDLKNHPCYNGGKGNSHDLLVRLQLNAWLRKQTTIEQIYALVDLVSELDRQF